MSPRPIHHAELGRFFEGFKRTKDRRGWSAEAHLAKTKRFRLLTRQVLLRLASGMTKWPDPDVLREFAGFYDVPYEVLVAEVVRHAYDVRLAPSRIDAAHVLALESRLAEETRRRQDLESKLAPFLKAAESALTERRKPPDERTAKSKRTG